MAEVVDAIIAELILRTDQYEAGARRAAAVHKELIAAISTTGAADQAVEQSAARQTTARRKQTDEEKAAAREAAAVVKQAAKEKADAEKAAAREVAAAEKAAAKERLTVAAAAGKEELARVRAEEKEKAALARQAARERIAAIKEVDAAAKVAADAAAVRAARAAELDASAAARIIHEPRVQPALVSTIGQTVPRGSGAIPASPVAGPSLAADREINATLLQRVELQERLKVATADEAVAIRQQLTELSLATTYERAGLDAKEAALRLDRELAVIEGQRATRAAERVAADQSGIVQLGLRAQIAATSDRVEAVALQDQLAALRQIESYKARGLTQSEAVTRVEAETLALEQRRVTAMAEQAALVEKQMRAQQGAIAGKISGAGVATGALVGGLGLAEISHLNDKYIELSNSLKVAGVSASEFDQVQGHLLATANRNGTDINALADVFRSASLGAHDLGLSQADLLKITDAASNSLRIQGVSSEKARGSLLQLGHAFESGRVNAREFNSLALNLYPILQAAAKGSDAFGGSVAKLRASIIAGTVSSKDFAQAIVNGAADLEARASKATLTTAQGFQSLSNALVVYFGQADEAQGVSAALGTGLASLGRNLDTLIPAIAAIGTALTVGYISRMTAAAVATRGLGASVLGAFGGPVGLAITAVGLAIAGTVVEVNDARLAAQQAASGLKALQDQYGASGHAAAVASTGIKGVGTDALGAIPHVNSFAGAVGNLAQQLYNQARAARAARVESLQQQLQESQKKETDISSKLPGGLPNGYRRGDVIGNASTFLSNTYNRLTNTLSGGYQDQDYRAALTGQVKQSLILQKQIADARTAPITPADIPGGANDNPNQGRIDKIQKEIDDLKKIEAGTSGKRRAKIDSQIEKRQQQIDALAEGVSPAAAAASTYTPGIGGGKSAETLQKEATARQKRFSDELAQIHDRYLQSEAQQATGSAASYRAQEEKIKADQKTRATDYLAQEQEKQIAAGRAAELIAQDKITVASELKAVELRKQVDAYNGQTAAIARQNAFQDELTAAQSAFADTAKERLDLAKQQIETERQRAKDAAIRTILSPDPNVSDQERIAAGDALRNADPIADAKLKVAGRQNETPGQSYVRSLKSTPDTIQDSEVHALQQFNTELDKSVSKALHLHGIFGSIVDDLIDMAVRQAVIKPLANALFPGAGGGTGGFFGSILRAVGIGGGAFPSGLSGSISGAGSIGGSGILDLGSNLAGWASGGSGVIGGTPGIDRNILSLNGTPIRKVGQGELLTVSPNIGSSNGRVNTTSIREGDRHVHVAVYAENSVTPAGFAQGLAAQILQEADRMDSKRQGATLGAVPGRVQGYQARGT